MKNLKNLTIGTMIAILMITTGCTKQENQELKELQDQINKLEQQLEETEKEVKEEQDTKEEVKKEKVKQEPKQIEEEKFEEEHFTCPVCNGVDTCIPESECLAFSGCMECGRTDCDEVSCDNCGRCTGSCQCQECPGCINMVDNLETHECEYYRYCNTCGMKTNHMKMGYPIGNVCEDCGN